MTVRSAIAVVVRFGGGFLVVLVDPVSLASEMLASASADEAMLILSFLLSSRLLARTRLCSACEHLIGREMRYAVLVGLAITARLIMLLFIQPGAGGDAVWYLHAAELIRSGHVPDLYRPPLYPIFLALLPYWKLAWFLQPLMTIGVGCLCLRLTNNFLAAVLIVTCPFFIVYEFGILAETVLIALLVTAWLFLERGRAVLPGILLGLAMLTRDTVQLLPLFVLAVGYFVGRGRQFLIVTATAYLVIAPWVLTQGNLSSGRSGYALWIGTWERNADWQLPGLDHAAYPPEAFTRPGQEQQLRAAYAQGRDDVFRKAAIDRISSDPRRVLETWAVRYPKLWFGTRTEQATLKLQRGSAAWTSFKGLMWTLNALILALGLLGMVLCRRWILAIPVVYTALAYIPFHNSETRYSLPALPFLLIAAASLIYLKRRSGRATGAAPEAR